MTGLYMELIWVLCEYADKSVIFYSQIQFFSILLLFFIEFAMHLLCKWLTLYKRIKETLPDLSSPLPSNLSCSIRRTRRRSSSALFSIVSLAAVLRFTLVFLYNPSDTTYRLWISWCDALRLALSSAFKKSGDYNYNAMILPSRQRRLGAPTVQRDNV